MKRTSNHSSHRGAAHKIWCAGLVSLGLVASACSSDKAATPATTPVVAATDVATTDTSPPPTEAVAATDPVATGDTDPPAVTEPVGTEPTGEVNFSSNFPDLAPPTGEEIVIGLVNTEGGAAGLDFPEIRIDVLAVVDYLNQHGGLGGRPIKMETCAAKGSPETSQACAQELAGKGVEMVMLGLDLFPDYATYTAADIPVVGVLPIFPADNTADALFLTGGNATTTGAMANVAKNHYKAATVGIVSADNPGANGTEASLVAALDLAGIAHITIKGGDNETDAGYQGLVREAAKDNPDLLISLYAGDGCIGTMRGRASLGITIPVITTSICSGKEVLDEVGDDALGWAFVGVSTQKDTPELAIVQEMLAPALGLEPSEVDSTALGLGALGMIGMMTLTQFANMMAADGQEVTGASLYDYLGASKGVKAWPNGAEIDCGAAEKYPTFCAFTFPVGEYVAGGKVETVPGLDAVSAKDYLP